VPAANAERAKRLRRDQTDVERKLWFALRDRQLDGAKFRRQMPVGSYIVDFVCVDRKLIIELDGGQHTGTAAYDDRRTRSLARRGYRVVRFWNNDVIENLDGVLSTIQQALVE
jgi:very-short-patch-repair endonuclease